MSLRAEPLPFENPLGRFPRTVLNRQAADNQGVTSGANQCAWPQPEPQPAEASGSSPSATWKLCPQPQAETTFGLSILKPDSCRPSRKSIVEPCRYGALNGSTTTLTPWNSSSWSPDWAPRSNPSAYSKPLQPPPWIAMRSTSASPAGSPAISALTFVAARAVSVTTVVSDCSTAAMNAVYPRIRRRELPRLRDSGNTLVSCLCS